MTSSSTPVSHTDSHLSSSLRENRVFPPPPEFAARAHVRSLAEYEELYARSIADPEAFWDGIARELHWFSPWTKTLDWQEPWAKWFVGGKINLSYNCLDRHVQNGKKDKTAILWEGEPGEVRKLSYGELLADVERFANALK
ncbi:MAG TPA: acetyl-coenzyme A synthetase N-terminal domain-containing protein, partial [Terracidiphilus sp.]